MDKELTLAADTPDVDLRTLDLPPTALSKLVGKPPPRWHVTDARGVPKEVQLSDFKGKWVLVEFWGHWCGPWVARSLPKMIDLYEEYHKDRNKFQILAFHDGTAKDLADVDRKVERVRRRYWGGQDLPFPILLDATGQTIKEFGIQAFPTLVLIDPEGRLVCRVAEEHLDETLAERRPPLPLPERVARRLDRPVRVFLDDPTLEQAVEWLSGAAGLPIRLDRESLKRVSSTPAAQAFVKMNTSISLRSALHLVLDANGLTYEQDDQGLLIRPRRPGESRHDHLTEAQRAAVRRIEKALDQEVALEFQGKPLAEATEFFQGLTMESFVLDPTARKAGRLDPKTPVPGSAKQVPLREALKRVLDLPDREVAGEIAEDIELPGQPVYPRDLRVEHAHQDGELIVLPEKRQHIILLAQFVLACEQVFERFDVLAAEREVQGDGRELFHRTPPPSL
jgi:thiol-disulfide isomerase/thioredoxin